MQASHVTRVAFNRKVALAELKAIKEPLVFFGAHFQVIHSWVKLFAPLDYHGGCVTDVDAFGAVFGDHLLDRGGRDRPEFPVLFFQLPREELLAVLRERLHGSLNNLNRNRKLWVLMRDKVLPRLKSR